MKPEQFFINISEQRLTELERRLDATCWPGDFGNADWRYGVEQSWLQEMVAYWRNGFDWRKQEAHINAFPHFRVTIDNIPIHFIHIRSGRPNAIPLLLIHGWPWTFWDWRAVLQSLSSDTDGPAFDLVVPSLPGAIFSAPLTTSGLNVRAIAGLWVKLMTTLGYDRFAAAGGDWGAIISAELGHSYPDRLLAIHLGLAALLPGLDYTALKPEDYAEDEQWMVTRNAEAPSLIASHMTVQSNDPQTLAYALADSPVGTAAWLWERRRAWKDRRTPVDQTEDRDFLCTTASLYWLTNTIGSSMRIYREQYPHGVAGGMAWPRVNQGGPIIKVPTGIAVAPKELAHLPRAFAAEQVNLQHWTLLPRGGHFLPYEEPVLLADEYRKFFAAVV